MTAIHWNPQTIGCAWSARFFFGKHRTVGEKMRSAIRVVEVRAQDHCDASIVKVQGAFDELSRQNIGWISNVVCPMNFWVGYVSLI
jgi:hypothetical protein